MHDPCVKCLNYSCLLYNIFFDHVEEPSVVLLKLFAACEGSTEIYYNGTVRVTLIVDEQS